MVRIVKERDGSSSQTVECPLCSEWHSLRRTKKGEPFFHCDRIGYGSVVFFRTEFGRQKLRKWASRPVEAPLFEHEHKEAGPSDLVNRPREGHLYDDGEEDALARYLREKPSRSGAGTACLRSEEEPVLISLGRERFNESFDIARRLMRNRKAKDIAPYASEEYSASDSTVVRSDIEETAKRLVRAMRSRRKHPVARRTLVVSRKTESPL